MTNDSVFAKLEPVFREVFEDDDFEFSLGLNREDLKSWDSLGHIRLVSATEDAFDIRLTIDEIGKISSVADIVQMISDHQAG